MQPSADWTRPDEDRLQEAKRLALLGRAEARQGALSQALAYHG